MSRQSPAVAHSLVAPAFNRETTEATSLVLRVFAPHPDIENYNPYGNSRRARIVREHTTRSQNYEPVSGGDALKPLLGGVLRMT